MVEKLPTVDKGQNEIELLRRLEGKLEGDYEGIVDLSQD